jgi:hypothetical protein
LCEQFSEKQKVICIYWDIAFDYKRLPLTISFKYPHNLHHDNQTACLQAQYTFEAHKQDFDDDIKGWSLTIKESWAFAQQSMTLFSELKAVETQQTRLKSLANHLSITLESYHIKAHVDPFHVFCEDTLPIEDETLFWSACAISRPLFTYHTPHILKDTFGYQKQFLERTHYQWWDDDALVPGRDYYRFSRANRSYWVFSDQLHWYIHGIYA